MAGYDDRDGFIWMDGKLVDWRSAKVHILTHALHYASSVFEGERCYNGKIFKGREHSERLRFSGELLDMPIPYTRRPDRRRQGGHAQGQQPDRRLCPRHRLARRGRGHGRRQPSATRSAWPSRPGPGATTTATPR
jgi:branched-subunit amino acid aminotransferase/4-amino-4-deoxychorismate lyase